MLFRSLAPPTFESDQLNSYEIGYKSETAGGTVAADLALYYVDWDNIQVAAVRSGFGVRANASAASVLGAEAVLTVRPTPNFTSSGALAYQDAKLAEAAPDLRARKGERLPNVPRFTAALNADYMLSIEGLEPAIGVTVRHVSERRASYDASVSFPQYRLPDYTSVDLRASVVLSSVSVQLYANNVFDERGQLSATYRNIVQVGALPPRTIGVRLYGDRKSVV